MKCTMKNAIPVALTLTVLLAGCVKPKLTRSNMTGGTESVIPTQRVSATEAEVLWTETGSTAEPTEIPVQTQPSESPTEKPAEPSLRPSQPPATETRETEQPETQSPATNPPEPHPPATEMPATEPPVVESPETEPQATDPPVTEPPETELPTLSPPVTEPDKAQIDTSAIESYAGSYAASLGFVIDYSLGKGNSGYYPPDYRVLNTTEDGYSPAAGLVSATKNQLNSRFSSEKSDVLVEGAYGLARMNCRVEYSHTDELGDWYYIYVFYG